MLLFACARKRIPIQHVAMSRLSCYFFDFDKLLDLFELRVGDAQKVFSFTHGYVEVDFTASNAWLNSDNMAYVDHNGVAISSVYSFFA